MEYSEYFEKHRRREVSLEEVLEARDRRVERQSYLTATHRTPLISFTLNMPGGVKKTSLSSFFFNDRLTRLKMRLRAMGADIEEEIVTSGPAGDEAILAISYLSALSLKVLSVDMEERSVAGRLLDLDVIDEDGKPVKRTAVGAEPRRCLLCDRQASVCGSSRAHSLNDLTGKVTGMLEHAVYGMLVDEVVSMAGKASSFELMVSMKPGLVTYTDSGSHSDMDRFTFVKSQASLLSYYRDAFLAGRDDSDKAIVNLRLEGMEAEQRMFHATDGVNTHRGWIYIAGILSAAAGRISASMLRGDALSNLENEEPLQNRTVDMAALLSEMSASIAHALEESLGSSFFENTRKAMKEHRSVPPAVTENSTSHPHLAGVSNFQVASFPRFESASHPHLAGVRKEAVSGFPSVINVGVPILTRALKRGDEENLAGQRALFALLAAAEDTTLVKRGGSTAIPHIRRYVLEALDLEDEHEAAALICSALALGEEALHAHLKTLSEYFIDRRLSCGGVADLLAGSYFARDLCSLLERIAAHC